MSEKYCCERLLVCPFFKTAKEANQSQDVLNEYVNLYCRGPFIDRCYRMQYLKRHGELPGESIAPSGLDFRQYINI